MSVGVPVRNGARFLAETLDSLLAQSHADFELLISDNASTDETQAIGRAYAARDPEGSLPPQRCRSWPGRQLQPPLPTVAGKIFQVGCG